MLSKKDRVVAELTKGIQFLFKKHVMRFHGEAVIKSASEIEVTSVDGKGRNSNRQHCGRPEPIVCLIWLLMKKDCLCPPGA